LERDRLLGGFHQHGDFAGLAGDWVVEAQADLKQGRADFMAMIREEMEDLGPNGKPLPSAATYHLKVENSAGATEADAKDSQSPYRQAVRKRPGCFASTPSPFRKKSGRKSPTLAQEGVAGESEERRHHLGQPH